MLNCLIVGLGGFAGAVMRYLLGLIPLPHKQDFPFITLFINIAGAFAIGVIAAVSAKYRNDSAWLNLFLKVGVCGGFTTFSTFSLESFNLFSSGKTALGLLYMFLSVAACLLAVFCGTKCVPA